MSARIVFSDGSKELAHNTDDLLERWRLRRAEEREYFHRQPSSNAEAQWKEEVKWREPETEEQAKVWYSEMQKLCAEVEIHQRTLKSEKDSIPVRQYAVQANALQAELEYRRHISRLLKVKAKELVRVRHEKFMADVGTASNRKARQVQQAQIEDAHRKIKEANKRIASLLKENARLKHLLAGGQE